MKFLKNNLFFIIAAILTLAGILCAGLISPHIILSTSSGSTTEVSTLYVAPFASIFGGEVHAWVSVETFRNGFSAGISSVTDITPSLTVAFDYVTFIGLVLAIVGIVLAFVFRNKKGAVIGLSFASLVGAVLTLFQGEMFNTLNYAQFVEDGQNCGALGSAIGGTFSHNGIGGIVCCVLLFLAFIFILIGGLKLKKIEKKPE